MLGSNDIFNESLSLAKLPNLIHFIAQFKYAS